VREASHAGGRRRPTLAQVAERTGYASRYAFTAAFRRYHGQPPGCGANSNETGPHRRMTAQETAGDGIHFV
jgi:AraC-like DNA-binding protein